MPELVLHVGRAAMGHQKQRGIGVPCIVRVPHPQPRRPTHPDKERLDLSLAEGPNVVLSGIDEQQIDTTPATRPKTLFFQVPEVVREVGDQELGQVHQARAPALGLIEDLVLLALADEVGPVGWIEKLGPHRQSLAQTEPGVRYRLQEHDLGCGSHYLGLRQEPLQLGP